MPTATRTATSRVARRVAGVTAIAFAITVTVIAARWTLSTPPNPTDHDTLPLVFRLLIVFFTVEAARMFIQVMIGATFYEATRWPTATGPRPLVSVVIPAWNEEVGLGKTIESVLASDYPNLEIIVVDDGSTDQTPEIARWYAARHPMTVFAISQRNAGKGAALNQGVLHALGEIIVNVDADSAVETQAIGNLVRPIVLGSADAVVGRIVVGRPRGTIPVTQAFEYAFGFHLRRTQSVLNTIYILSGAMCAYRRSAYRQTKGFRDYSKTEDLDFSLQLRDVGARLVYADDAVCFTEGAANLRGLRSQRTRWRYGAFKCLGEHRRLIFDRRPGRRSLGWYELPTSVLAYVQVLLYPFVLAIAFGLPIYTGEYIYLLLIFCAVPMNFVIVFCVAGTLRQHLRSLPLLTPLMIAAMGIEHITMWTALGEMTTGRSTGWTKWQRLGVDGHAPLLAPVLVGAHHPTALAGPSFGGGSIRVADIPQALITQFASRVPSNRDFDALLDAELELLVDDGLRQVPQQDAAR